MGVLRSIQSEVVKFRLPLIVLAHLALTSSAYLFSLGLRFDFTPEEIFGPHRLLLPLSLLLFFRHSTYTYWQLNRGYWRYTSTQDLIDLLKAHALSSLLFTASLLLFRIPQFPRSVVIIEFAISLLTAGGARFLVRVLAERIIIRSSEQSNGQSGSIKEVVVLGAGDSGHFLVKNLVNHRRLGYKPVAVLDDSQRMQGASVHGIRVTGKLNDLKRCLEEHPKVAAVMIAIPSLSSTRMQQLEILCKEMGIPIKRLQAFEDLAYHDLAEAKSNLSIEASLEKEIEVQYEDEIRAALRGKRVLVTGAGGSIGSELVRQLAPFQLDSLMLLDNGEFNLYRIDLEIARDFPTAKRIPVLGSIGDRKRLRALFREHQPELVFHAAAYKHVPMVESNCYEAFQNNIVGTKNLLECCSEFPVQRFVLISSDKAVNPASVMGCSKRIAELLVNQFGNRKFSQGHSISTAIVRFGNVINSAGSVIPLFKEQLLSGGPITVTHPDMERYFMSIREAVRLVLTAGILGQSGEIFMLDMGKPIKIVEVAKKMLALYGRRDIEIRFVGIRPGEKLTEELNSQFENWHNTKFRKVFRVTSSLECKQDIHQWTVNLEDRLSGLRNNQISAEMFNCLAQLQSSANNASSQKQELGGLGSAG